MVRPGGGRPLPGKPYQVDIVSSAPLQQLNSPSTASFVLTGVVAQEEQKSPPSHKLKMTMNDGFNLKTLFPRYVKKHFLHYNFIGDRIILSVFTIFICIAGLVGNGNIIWLLGFRIKRKPFATYVLNLAAADFGSLAFLLPLNVYFNPPTFDDYLELPAVVGKLLTSLFASIYTSRQLLLTAISIDRWVSVLFPNWYQCHRSPVVSTSVCAFIWALSFALVGVSWFMSLMNLTSHDYDSVLLWGHMVISLICLLLVIISTLTLFIKVCLKSQRCQCGNLLKVILLILVSYLLVIILSFASLIMFSQIQAATLGLWTSLQNSINPLIYFLAGRQSGGKFQERMKVILQRVFKEERDTGMELQPRTQTGL